MRTKMIDIPPPDWSTSPREFLDMYLKYVHELRVEAEKNLSCFIRTEREIAMGIAKQDGSTPEQILEELDKTDRYLPREA